MQTGDLNMDAVTANSIMDMAESTDMPMATDSDELVPSLQVNMWFIYSFSMLATAFGLITLHTHTLVTVSLNHSR